MTRAIVQLADLSGNPLDELKQWLGITRTIEDTQLVALLQTSLELCHAYTGQMPLEVTVEETLDTPRDWVCLSARPVRSITGVEAIESDNIRTQISGSAYETEIDGHATGSLRLIDDIGSTKIAVTYLAGIADNWNALPAGLRHGIIRLAAYHYQTRDTSGGDNPPAAVTALWRPWKTVRL